MECPHCHAQTELQPIHKARRNISRLLIFAAIGVVIAVGMLISLKLKPPSGSTPQTALRTNAVLAQPEPSRPKALDDLKVVGTVVIERAQGRRLSYVVGTITNDSEHQRFGVKVELELFDSAGTKLPMMASDYVQTLAARQEWIFRALVLEPKAVTAKAASIKED